MKKALTFIATALVIFMFALTLNNSNKVLEVKDATNTDVNPDNSKAMIAHILAFKQKMQYYKDNTGLRSDEKEQVDSTVLDWESTINLTYCYSYLELSDSRVYDTTLVLPPVSQDSMLMSDISNKYYNEIVYAVQAQYFKAPFADSVKKLMAVDLEKTTGGDSLHIKSLVGNTMAPAHPAYDWKYGNYLGTCDGQHSVGTWDAAHEIADNTRNHFYEAPPANCRWYFYGPIQTITVDDPTSYSNPTDPPPANYKDYLVYYASSALGTITADVLCLEHYDELAFYKNNYINLTQDWINGSSGRKFKDCDYTGTQKNIGNIQIYKHKLRTFLGYRGIVCDISIEDISAY